MDLLRYNCTQLYERPYICRDTVGFVTTLIFSHFLSPFRFPTYPYLSLNTVPEEKNLSTPVLSITPSD
jgi:hypothetical protein